jgi:cysteine synthase A
MKIFDNIQATIGLTPLVRFKSDSTELQATVLLKLEFFNPLGSVKDRIGQSLIETALKDNKINQNTLIVEPTSGNTGLALAFICAQKGMKCCIVMPETMSLERKKVLKHMGAELVLTPGSMGMKGAIQQAQEILEKQSNSFMPDQFNNPANPYIHKITTAEEIWNDTEGQVDVLVSGVGTGGTLSGVGEVIKSRKPEFKVIAVEPKDSPVISGGEPGPHKIQGIGAGFIPGNLNTSLIDEVVTVSNEDAIETARKLSNEQGILCGISSGAATWASMQIAKRDDMAGKTIVTVLPSTGERYISTDLFKN